LLHGSLRHYTGVAKFVRRIDPAAEQLVTSKSESFETRKLTLQNDLSGDRAVECVVEDLGLTRNLPRTSSGSLTPYAEMKKQELVRRIKAAIKMEWEVKSDQVDLISVAFTCPDPMLAQYIPNAIVNNYIGWVSEQTVDRLKASERFLAYTKDKCQNQLDTIMAEKIGFETKHAGAMPQSPGVLDEQIRGTARELDVIKRQKGVADARLMLLSKPSHAWATSEPSGSQPSPADVSVEGAVCMAEIDALQHQQASLTARQEEYRRLQMDYVAIAKDYDGILRRLKDKTEEAQKWDAQHLQVQMALAAESAKKRTQYELIVAAQPQFVPDPVQMGPVLGFTLGGGLLFGVVLAIVAFGANRSLNLTGTALLLGLVFAAALLFMGAAGPFKKIDEFADVLATLPYQICAALWVGVIAVIAIGRKRRARRRRALRMQDGAAAAESSTAEISE
jgi:hypothetical protein